jgi:hypothetical protein
MKVFVVMGNDFPDAVFDNEAAAENYCVGKRGNYKEGSGIGRIYWRIYEFELQESKRMATLQA